MEHAEFLSLIDELLDLAPGTLTGGELLEGLEDWNSLAVIGFMAMVNERTGKIVSPPRIAACSTVDDLWKLSENPS